MIFYKKILINNFFLSKRMTHQFKLVILTEEGGIDLNYYGFE